MRLFKDSLCNYHKNNFVQYLIDLLDPDKTKELIQHFYIGTSDYAGNWNGATVFWLLNEQGRSVGGQVFLFDDNGHTFKEIRPNGDKKRYNSWIHCAVKYEYNALRKPLPQWLKNYMDNGPKFPCLFGLPQLRQETAKPIAIVESAKTAIIATAYFPQYLWMAAGGLTYLNEEKIQSLKDQNITLFPDKGGYDLWSKKARSFSHIANIHVSDFLELKNAFKGAGLADFLVQFDWRIFHSGPSSEPMNLLKEEEDVQINEYGYPVSWDI